MSMVTYPLNNVEYTAEDAELFHVTRTSGVYANNSFDYSLSGADNTVVIGKGIAWIKNSEFSGKVVAQKEAVSLNMGLPDANYPRIDAIIIKFDANSNSTDIVVKEGTASSNPIAPVVTRTESIYELHLYHVRRNAGSLYIVANDITDLRTDNNYCGLMADSVTAIDAVPFERRINGYTLEQDINLTASDVGAVPTSRTVNGNALSANIELTAEDVGAVNSSLQTGTLTAGVFTWTGSDTRVAKQGKVVCLYIYGTLTANINNSTPQTILTLPTGFRPVSALSRPGQTTGSAFRNYRLTVSTSGTVQLLDQSGSTLGSGVTIADYVVFITE